MRTLSFNICLFGLFISVGCNKTTDYGESYELSEVENPGESLNDDDDVEAEDGDSTDADESTETDETAEEQVDNRTYAQKLVVSMMMPGVFNPSNLEETSTISYLLVHWTRVGTEVTWTEELCHIRATEAHNTQTTFPAAFVNTMPIREHYATLSAEEVGAEFVVDTFVNVDGAALPSPESDRLPTSASDSRLVDQDSDGHPGITIHIDAPWGVSGNIYLAQRSHYSFEGVVTAQDRVEAYVTYDQEQSIIDASSGFLTMADVVPTPNPDETTSYVLFQEVDDDTDCSDIKRDNDALF